MAIKIKAWPTSINHFFFRASRRRLARIRGWS